MSTRLKQLSICLSSNHDIAGKSDSVEVRVEPVRKVLIFILPHSHHDLGYTDLQSNVEEKQMANISRGIELARNTANYPPGARFVWNLEVLSEEQISSCRIKNEPERQELISAVRKGWIGLNGMYANELTGLCRPEELLQLFRYGTELGSQCGTPVDSAMISDVPGYTWGTVSAMAQAGIRYFSAAPNFFDRIGTFMVERQDKPFWWVSPSQATEKSACLGALDWLCNVARHEAGHTVGQRIPSQTG